MERRSINPWRWQDDFGFVQAEEVKGAKTVLYCAGQTATDAQGTSRHPNDMRAQLDMVLNNVETVLGTVKGPNLPDAAVDYVLLVDAYHEFDHPREMMLAVRKALRPGGRVILVEFRGEDANVPIKPLHKMTEAQAKRELHAAGLKHVETLNDLPWQHVMFFERPSE